MPKTKNLEHLKSLQYQHADKLNARWNLYDFCNPPIDIHAHALAALELKGHETVLDLGCTDGAVLNKLRENFSHKGSLIGVDINETIFAEAKKKYADMKFLVGTANALPLPDKSVDVITAFFVMYHAEDIALAMKELSRVLKDGGRVVFSTGAKGNLDKKRAMKERAGEMLHAKASERFNVSFNFENATEQIAPCFEIEKEYLYEGEIRITSPKIYLDSIDSVRDMFEPVPGDAEWQKTLELFSEEISLEISKNGCYTDPVRRGYLIGKKK